MMVKKGEIVYGKITNILGYGVIIIGNLKIKDIQEYQKGFLKR